MPLSSLQFLFRFSAIPFFLLDLITVNPFLGIPRPILSLENSGLYPHNPSSHCGFLVLIHSINSRKNRNENTSPSSILETSGFWFSGFFRIICDKYSVSFKRMSVLAKGDSVHIREVWNDNLNDEFALIRDVVEKYPYVAMDTEFPGIVLRPIGNFKSPFDYNYQTLKANVDLLRLIQLGLTFSDEKGNLPTCGTDEYCVWQINFCEFNPNEDVYANDSIELLSESGIDFKKNKEKGVSAFRFSELLMSSGVVLNHDIHWVTFHSGYDFGYLLKLLTRRNLPDTQAEFFNLIKIYFPNLYDMKHLMKFCNSLHGGLNKLAELLDVERIGISHQAGSDSLLTCCTFMKLKDNFFNGSPEKYAGVLYGLGVENDQDTN